MVIICLAGLGRYKTITCNIELETLKCLLLWSLGAVIEKVPPFISGL